MATRLSIRNDTIPQSQKSLDWPSRKAKSFNFRLLSAGSTHGACCSLRRRNSRQKASVSTASANDCKRPATSSMRSQPSSPAKAFASPLWWRAKQRTSCKHLTQTDWWLAPSSFRGTQAKRVLSLHRSSNHSRAQHSVRVDLGRLDDIMRTVGELVITRSRLESGLERRKDCYRHATRENCKRPARQWSRHLRELREGVMRVRLVPVRDAFARMRLVVRELSRSMGKDVHLSLIGEETEIDKFVVERVADPLLHLVRNAVSHGVERPEERVAAGEARPRATATSSRSGRRCAITIEVEDDGRGIDSERVFARGRRRASWQRTHRPFPPPH